MNERTQKTIEKCVMSVALHSLWSLNKLKFCSPALKIYTEFRERTSQSFDFERNTHLPK
jgi:hypothetical protein